MRKYLVSLLAAIFIAAGFASAQPLTFGVQDSGVRYAVPTEDDDPVGYLQLASDASGLSLVLSRSKLDGSLPAIHLLVPDRGEDQFGLTRRVELQHLEGIELTAYGNRYSAFAVTHPDTAVGDVLNAYQSALASLGFSGVVDSQVGNVTVGVFQGSSGSLRAVFHQFGKDVTVHVSPA